MASPTARELPVTLDLPSSLLREIAKVITRHTALEWKLNRMIYTLLGIDLASGRIAVREPRTTDRLDMIADLLNIKKISVQSDVAAIREALTTCTTERDWLAHGLWFKNPDHPGKLFLRVLSGNWVPPGTRGKSKRRIDPEAMEYDTDQAKKLVTLIEKTGQAIYNLSDEIDAALGASHEKSL